MMIQVDNQHVFSSDDNCHERCKAFEFPRALSPLTLWAIAPSKERADELLMEFARERNLNPTDFFLAGVHSEPQQFPHRKTTRLKSKVEILKACNN